MNEKPVLFKYNPQWVVARIHDTIPHYLPVEVKYNEITREYRLFMTMPDLRDILKEPLVEQVILQSDMLEPLVEDENKRAELIQTILAFLAHKLLRRITHE